VDEIILFKKFFAHTHNSEFTSDFFTSLQFSFQNPFFFQKAFSLADNCKEKI